MQFLLITDQKEVKLISWDTERKISIPENIRTIIETLIQDKNTTWKQIFDILKLQEQNDQNIG